ncbi:DUF1565 domain-containing protein [Mucilaginibacter rubeus]|uniref:DUF1565 domain-containing protein n=1 Tax=Mucilaginibacter rubeus TaxID=2027860 RepID=A0A5C1HYD3_9SPHI|nr:right-handed parallel beta-helix repeat-containing protein [Mucilaginibacter rubeus]QEM10695.1 DUF1565 domain-containing protein [Mucilaginibacter rubeus]
MKFYITVWLLCFFAISTMATCKKNADRHNKPLSDSAHAYYVAVDGSDNNKGSINAPFQTINAALSHAIPGDVIMVRGGRYYDKVVFPKPGIKNKTITLKAYPGEKPVLDGSKIIVTGWAALVTLRNVAYITLDGFEICNLTSSAHGVDPEGIAIDSNSHDITIKNCDIHNIKNNASLADWRSGHAILVIGNGTAAITNLVITGCEVHDTQTGTSENVTLAGNVDGFIFSHNKVYDTENIGVIVAGGDNLNPKGALATNYARNGVISDNEFHDNTMTKTPETWGADRYGAISIYVCGGANTIIERNIVYNSDRGIGLVSESNIYATKTTIVRNNFVYNCYRTGIYMGDYLNYTTGGTKDCYVVNNTLYQNDRVLGAFGEIEGEIRLTEHCDNNVIKNNIVFARPVDVFIHKYTTTGSNNIIDNNLYYTTGTPQWIWNSTNGAPLTSFDAWKATSDNDANSTNGLDPLLLSTAKPDLRIQSSSPAKNSGVVISVDINGKTDIDEKARIVNRQISKGAFQ